MENGNLNEVGVKNIMYLNNVLEVSTLNIDSEYF